MSIVRINAITVPDGSGDELSKRFAKRIGEVEHMAGFESFELLRPVSGNTWYVYTRWASEEDFLAWVQSPAFARGHQDQQQPPVAHGSELLSFDVVLTTSPADASPADASSAN